MTTVLTPAPAATATRSSSIPFRRLVAVEWGKATDTRASRWLLAAAAAGTVGAMLAPILASGSVDQTVENYLAFSTLGVSVLLPIAGILVLTSEWSQRTALTTFTQEPRRARVIGAKLAAIGILTALGIVVSMLVGLGTFTAVHATGRTMDASMPAGLLIGVPLMLAFVMAVGCALAILIQNSPAAIVANFALPTVLGLLVEPIGHAGDWITPDQTTAWLSAGSLGHVAPMLTATLLWVVAPLVAGTIRTVRRDVG